MFDNEVISPPPFNKPEYATKTGRYDEAAKNRYRAGYAARMRGDHKDDPINGCPYDRGDPHSTAWCCGWFNANNKLPPKF